MRTPNLDSIVQVRLKNDEKELLVKKAAEAGVSHSEYLRMILTGRPLNHYEASKEIGELTDAINSINNGVNRIVRNANLGIATKEDIRQVKESLSDIRRLEHEVVMLIGNKQDH